VIKSSLRQTSPLRIAIDTGGTFTDCVWLERGRLRILKLFSTPNDPSRSIADAVSQVLKESGAQNALLLHGTTVGTNSVLERRGARVAFVTTRGFEDTLEIGRQARPKLYDFFFDAIPPLVPPELRFGVEERTDKNGAILRAPSESDLRVLADRIRAAAPESIALSTLFSFANPANESAIAEALKELGLAISLSHRILPEFREYERASTVVMNAYLQPVMANYLRHLSDRLRKKASRIFVMQSNGGLASLERAAQEPVRTVLSGPAGGVVGAFAMARRSRFERIIGFDMGGTSTDVCLVSGSPQTTNEAEVAGLPVRVPMLNIHTVGAGGGSLARFDAGGALRVGPESAGADPGPIAYGRGSRPTVTDANLLLGRLQPDRFLGGEFALDLARTTHLTRTWLAQQPGNLTVPALAEGIIRVINANMEKAIRVVSVEKGYDPREFSLVAFGGAGALHACELAESLELPRVIVPQMPGALSAIGILMSDVVKDYSRTILRAAPSLRELESAYAGLTQNAKRDFAEEGWQGRIRFCRSLDLRYRGQGFELNIPFAPIGAKPFTSAFHAEHLRRYGYSHPEREVEVVTLRLRASLPSPELKFAASRRSPSDAAQSAQYRSVIFAGSAQKTRILDRSQVGSKRQSGPAIICEYSATTVVPPGWNYRLDKAAAILCERES